MSTAFGIYLNSNLSLLIKDPNKQQATADILHQPDERLHWTII